MRRALLSALLVACGGGPSKPANTTSTGTSTSTGTGTSTDASDANKVAMQGVTSGDAPEISRSVGETGGFVILWPRAKPESSAIAAQVQSRLADIVKRVAPGKPVDVRPEPQRVCPRTGCKAIAIGAAILRNGSACAVIATVSPSGQSDATIVAWDGDMTLKSPVAAFREPPEAQVQVRDYSLCSSLDLAKREKDIEAAIKLAAGL